MKIENDLIKFVKVKFLVSALTGIRIWTWLVTFLM